MAVDNILIDTNAYASFKRGDMAAVEIIRSSPFIGINSTVLGELLSGFAVGNRESLNRAESKPAIVWSISYLYKVPRGSDQVAVARRLRWQG